MGDIVESLLGGIENYTSTGIVGTRAGVIREAAEEILRLRQDTQRLREDNERLREGLEKIADGYGPNHISKYARDIATRALKAKEGGDV